MRESLKKTILAAAWLLPAAVLLFSGLAKIAYPEGSVPQSLSRITAIVPYSLLLRVLGAFELVVVIYMIVPSTRRTGAWVAMGLLASFTYLVAVNAHDHDFLRNCGCFGGLGATGLLSRLSGFGAIALRNSVLCGLLAMYLLGSIIPTIRLSPLAGLGSGAAALVFFSAAFLAQRDTAAQARVVQATMEGARQRCAFDLPLPEIRLVTPDKQTSTSTRELRDGDHILFFSPSCPHCRALAPTLAGLAHRVTEKGRRLVLIAVDDAPAVAEFKRTYGLDACPDYAVPDRFDPLRWGIDGVPKLIVMGEGGRAAYHHLQPRSGGLRAEIAGSDLLVEGLASDVWRRVMDALVGRDAKVSEFVRRGSLHVAQARSTNGELINICIGTVHGTPQHTIELALAMDQRGKILRLMPLTISGYARVVDPDARLFASFAGSAITDAVKNSERHADEATLEAPAWRSLALLLASIAAEFNCKPESP